MQKHYSSGFLFNANTDIYEINAGAWFPGVNHGSSAFHHNFI